MAVPTERELAEFVEHFDLVRPLGGLFNPLPTDKLRELRTFEGTLRKHAVSTWLTAQPVFDVAIEGLEARPFYKHAGPANQVVIGTRFLIDVGCALALSRRSTGPSVSSLANRKAAIKHARALAGLIGRGISLAAEGRTQSLYWALRDLADELESPVPRGSVRRRGGTFVARYFVEILAMRFLRAFGETLTGTLADLSTLIHAKPLSDDAIKQITSAVRQRRRRSRGTYFLLQERWRENGGVKRAKSWVKPP